MFFGNITQKFSQIVTQYDEGIYEVTPHIIDGKFPPTTIWWESVSDLDLLVNVELLGTE